LVEYDHYDFGNVKLRSYRAETGAFVNLVDVDQTMNLVSGGIRYKF
jgi:hypothetical protein